MGKTQESEYESFLSDDCLKDFLKTIKRNKVATKEENREMLIEYFNGNEEIKKNIIEKNLLLVVSIALRTGKNLSSDDKLEYIQSGIIGLIDAIDTFDLSLGTAFSTHAEYQIQMRINRYRYSNSKLVRRPEYIELALIKYRNLARDCEKDNKPLPSRSEICKLLGISDFTLKRIEEDYKLDAISYDMPVKNGDSDEADIKEVVGEYDDNFINVLDNVVIEELLKTLKMTLSEYEYYILYNRAIDSDKKTLEEISEKFAISRERIRQVETKIIAKVKDMFDENHNLKREYIDEVKKKYPFENINVLPCQVENYTMFFFLRDKFNEKDQIILREKLLGKLLFDSALVASELMESKAYVESKSREMDKLIKKASYDIHYRLFHNKLVDKYKERIFLLDPNIDLEDYLNIRNLISDYWQDKSIDDVESLASSHNLLDKELSDNIRRFFGEVSKKEITFNKDHVNRDVNYSLYGFANHEIPLSKLYAVFLENKDKLTLKQRDYLLEYVFQKVKKRPDINGYPAYYGDTVINKLLFFYYNVENYKKDNFSYEKYLSIRESCQKLMDERAIKLLDLWYGVQGNSMNTREMASYLEEDDYVVETDFRRAKNKAISIYLGTNQYSYEDDRDIYSKVLNDEDFTLKEPHLEIAKKFFLEGKTYEEIAGEYSSDSKMTQRKVAELVKYACSVMDYYRFGITSTKKNYSEDFLLSVLDKAKVSDEERSIIRTYIETKSTIATAQIHDHDLNNVRYLAKKINLLADRTAIEQVEITENDVASAVMEHESTNVLSERERIMLSLYYGLKNKYNPIGKKKYPIDIAEQFGIKANIGSFIRKAKEHVAAHKIGLLKTARYFINRKELERSLRDKRLPLSAKDRSIIINAYGLYDTEYLTTQEIAKRTGIKEPIVRKRLYNGIVTIKKYNKKEISGEILFEIDIEPYLKYFTLEDREILTCLYRDKWSYSEVEKEYNLSHHQLAILHQKMRMHLSDMRAGLAKGIDFDYFWSNALESDVPYYGNQQLAVELCFLYYEKNLSKSEIIKLHHPELGDHTVDEIINTYTVAMLKHQNGIRKINDFTYDEIAAYYERHKDDMGGVSTKIYRNYFEKVKKNGPLAKIRPNKEITYDLIREEHPDYFRLEKANPEQVREILKEHGDTLPKNVIEILESKFGVTHANVLSDEAWDEVVSFLGPIQLIDFKNRIEAKKITAAEKGKKLVNNSKNQIA